MKLLKYVVMTKLIILITAFAIHVSAATYAQQITLNYKDAPLRDVLQSVRKQSGYNFFFATDYLSKAKPVTINLNQATIEKTLQTIFENQPFEYTIKGKMITIKPAEKKVIDKVMDFYSAITIRGKVVDEEGKPLPGASIKAGSKTAVTDWNGEFILNGVDEGTAIEVTYLGYKSKIISASAIYMNIQLFMEVGQLSETTIKGYYSISKELNTGNVSGIRASDIDKQPVGDAIAVLQGKIPGLSIQQLSGTPGRTFTIRLRGQNSIANGNDPLFIVNGIPYGSKTLSNSSVAGGTGAGTSPFNDINPSDIESITVLKESLALSCQEES